MRQSLTVELIFGTYECISFTNVDPDEEGVEVYLAEDDTRLGSIIGLPLPEDEEDEDEMYYFKSQLEEWLLDNGH